LKRFGALYEALDATTSTNAKVAAMAAYFHDAAPADAAWALYFLSGRRLKRLIAPRLLAAWAIEETQTPPWLFEECLAVAGDLAETISLLLHSGGKYGDTIRISTAARDSGNSGDTIRISDAASAPALSDLIERQLLPLRDADEAARRAAVTGLWAALGLRETFLLNKLVTGELRVGVSDTLAVRALAQRAGLEPAVLSHRLMGTWTPGAAMFERLLRPADDDADVSRPYPFFLASPLQEPPAVLGDRALWLAEWKWDGIRAQLVRRQGKAWLWSRGEELITERFPDLADLMRALPDGCVLDGEVLAFARGGPLPFAVLQRRIGRQKLSAQILAEAPAAFMAYDLLEEGGADLRALPLHERRARLESIIQRCPQERLTLSVPVTAPSWEALAEARAGSRERAVEGLMLKKLDSAYLVGRKRGDWWKWKIDPYSIDAVLLYAQPGSGRRATLFTDLTFGLWDGAALVPVAKAYSGLTDDEVDALDRWIRQHTVERFGPVRHVEPLQVFELHFEGIAESPRHKSGVAVRFPRIARWRTDKTPPEADTLATLRGMIRG
jgi:DNA ligase-1